LQTAFSWFLDSAKKPQPLDERGRYMALALVCGYMKELLDAYRGVSGFLEKCALRGGCPKEVLEVVRAAAIKGDDSDYKLLERIRAEVAFHWKHDVFERWAVAQSDDDCVWAEAIGTRDGDVVHRASLQCLYNFLAPSGSADEQRREFERLVKRTSLLVKPLSVFVGHAIAGFLKTHNGRIVRFKNG
jgi:hypothetical protein